MNPVRCALIAVLVAQPLFLAAPLLAAEPTLKTTVILLVGQPVLPQGEHPTVDIVPGTVIPAGPQSSAAAGNGYASMYRKLRETYRLEWLATEKRELLDLTLGKEHRLPLVAPDIEAAITLREVDGEHASYEVRILEKGKVAAQPAVKVTRGTWATIGSRDGEAAPYLFILLGPWTADDEGLARAQKDFTPPKAITKEKLGYPEEARKAKITGIVVLRGTIGLDGTVSNIRVIESPDEILSKPAVEAFAKWTFEPGRDHKGAPVPYEFSIVLAFKLQ
jgi:TonB family protein